MRKAAILIPKLIDDLKKSGFLSEIEASQICKKSGWDINPNESFDDPHEEKSRAIDFVAWKERSFPKKENIARNGVQIFLACEVKKSEKPWIVFSEKDQFYHYPLANGSGLPKNLGYFSPRDPLEQLKKRIAHGIHESFKPPTESSRWYSAAITAIKAARHLKENETVEDYPTEVASYPEWFNFKLRYFFPVVVLDGDLFRAQKSSKGINLYSLDMMALRLSLKMERKTSEEFVVHVVSLKHLRKYLTEIENFQERMFERVFEEGKHSNKSKVMNDFLKNLSASNLGSPGRS